MLVLKQNVPQSFEIDYNIGDNDSKLSANITTAKFFLATAPGEADDKYLVVNYSSGLSYDSGTGIWTVQIAQNDLDGLNTDYQYIGVLAIQYDGEDDFREPGLFVGDERLKITIEPSYST